MTVITVQFNLPEDIDEWNIYKQATTNYLVIEDIRSEIRRLMKYEEISDETNNVLRSLRDLLPEDIG